MNNKYILNLETNMVHRGDSEVLFCTFKKLANGKPVTKIVGYKKCSKCFPKG